MSLFHHFLKIFLVLSPFLLDPDPYQNDTDPPHWLLHKNIMWYIVQRGIFKSYRSIQKVIRLVFIKLFYKEKVTLA